jgi:hypothetical protein
MGHEPPPPAPPEIERPIRPAATAAVAAGGSLEDLRRLHRRAVDAYASMDSYIVRLRRREQVDGKDRPEEVISMKFRKEPWSIALKWLGEEAKGREVLYVRGRFDDKIQILVAGADAGPLLAGKRFALAPDSPMVRSASRHDIRTSGIGRLVDQFGQLVDLNARGDRGRGTLTYVAHHQRPEFSHALEGAEQLIPSHSEPLLPRGGKRLWLFDPQTHLPAYIVTRDEGGRMVETYCFDRFQTSVKLDDDDFDPDKLWGPKKP